MSDLCRGDVQIGVDVGHIFYFAAVVRDKRRGQHRNLGAKLWAGFEN